MLINCDAGQPKTFKRNNADYKALTRLALDRKSVRHSGAGYYDVFGRPVRAHAHYVNYSKLLFSEFLQFHSILLYISRENQGTKLDEPTKGSESGCRGGSIRGCIHIEWGTA